MTEKKVLIPCSDCNTNKHVHSGGHADSYYACIFYNVACRNPECQQRWWPQDKMPRCTGNFRKQEDAEKAWNEGKSLNHNFSVGGRWTGD